MPYNLQDQALWDKIFLEFPSKWKTEPPTAPMRDCLDFFDARDVTTVLDVGCGVGRWSIYLAGQGYKVKGYDFSKAAVNAAGEWAGEEALDIEFKWCPITRAPFLNHTFDAAVAALVLDNVAEPEMRKAVELIRASLRDEGLLFALFNPHMTQEELAEAEAAEDNPTAGITLTSYTDEELRSAFQGFDLRDFSVYEQGLRGLFLRKTKD